MNPCTCGQPASDRLLVRYRYPRTEYTPEAMDPHYVHGGSSITTCGSPACEAEALLGQRARILASIRTGHGGIMPARELDDRDLMTILVNPETITEAEQPDGTVRQSWPSAPREAI